MRFRYLLSPKTVYNGHSKSSFRVFTQPQQGKGKKGLHSDLTPSPPFLKKERGEQTPRSPNFCKGIAKLRRYPSSEQSGATTTVPNQLVIPPWLIRATVGFYP